MYTPRFTAFLCVIAFYFCFQTGYSQVSKNGAFTFTISTQSRTSAGVYQTDSTLIRTLWSDSLMLAGTYTRYWDGKDDFGKSISSPDANYMIRVVSNNVNYTWDGIIGNTSKSNTGSTVHKGYYTSMTGMAIAGSTAFFCQGYSEGYSSQAKFNIANPQVRLDLNGFGGRQSTANVDFVATDGTNVYWAGYNAYQLAVSSIVTATAVSNDAQVSFGANGTSYTMTSLTNAKTYTSVLDLITGNVSARPTGLAVQVSGSCLFVAHGGTNELHVFNKTTGALMQNLSISNPRGLAVEGNNLWMVSGTSTLAKYTVNVNGALSPATLTLSGITTPGAIAVDAGEISVIDAGTTQVVRFYNTTSGTQGTQLGTMGGYFTDATVTNTKFLFDDYRGNQYGFLAYAPDGSFWVGDVGNYRELHFSAAKGYLEYIMSLGANYEVFVDPNNATRVFAGGLAAGGIVEFSIDYSQPLTGSTGWALVKNWGANVANNTNYHKSLRFPTTLSNGRTYAFIRKSNSITNQTVGAQAEFVELPSSGQLRFTGLLRNNDFIFAPDGSIQDITSANIGGTSTLGRYALTGFNGSDNPLWSGTRETLATMNSIGVNDPYNSRVVSNNVITSSNKILWWNPRIYAANGSTVNTGYHLGAMSRGGSTLKFKTEIATHINYTGAYPGAGIYEIGNGVHDNSGGTVSTLDNIIITSYHGEFWKNYQTNYFNQYDQYGLAIGQFGTDQYVAGGASAAAAGSAGNALTPMLVKNASGNYFMYHGDESDHGGLHRWSIDNLGSISAQTVNIAFPSSYIAPASGFIDLHAGLPFDGALPTSVGWSKSGAVSSYTSRKKYQNDGSPDVYSTFAQSSGTASVDRDLGTNNVSDSWKISGFLTFEGSDFTTGSKINSYVDVLDANSKVIARFFYQYTGGILSLRANNDVYLNNVSVRVTLNAMQPFEINVKNGVFTFSYAGNNPVATTIYDPAGNWQTPKTLRQYWTTGGTPAYGKNIGFMNMKFYKDFGTVPNIPPLANAGPDTTIILPKNNCMLKGVGVDNDGTIMSYSWTKTSGPAGGNIVNKSSATTALNALVKGVYEFSLKVVDNNGASAFDTIQISVDPPPNLPPIATAGNDQNLTLPTNITSLAGSGGDADGSITNYLWSKISGPSSYNIVNASSPVTDIAGMIQGIYLIQLEVTDNDGATAKDTIKITVNAALNIPPVVDAGKDTSIMSPSSTVFLNGSGSDIDGSIVNYLWKKISGPASFAIVNSSLAATDVTDLVAGVYTFQLKVTDNSGSATFDSLQVTVITLQNTPPAADAGTDTVLLLPKNKIDLTGAAIDPDGFIAGYSWTKIAGPSAMISSPSFLSTAVSGLVQGVYLFQLAVTDDQGAVGKDTITLNVMAAALPLKLLSFNAGLQNENVLLRWETSNEKNVSGFEIEKMTVNDWENLTFVNASSLNVFSNHYNSVDSFAKVGVTYYRLKIIDFDGKFVYSNIVSVDRKPTSNLIYQNYPNPFSNATTIKFEISEKTPVKIVIFNSGGIEVGVLVNEIKEPGSYEVNWNSRNIPPGSYFYNVITNENNLITKKMLKIR